MVVAIGTSTTDANQFRATVEFIGLQNYVRLFQDPAFLHALSNTVIIAALITVVPNALGLGIAILLDRAGWIFNALRAAFFVPIVLSSVVVSVTWGMILSDDGLLNSMLKNLGVADPPGWVSDPNLALYSIAGVICWQSLGVAVVLFLAGLQGIPRELLEAAEIDGAGRFARFRTVTWPLLAPVVTITVTLSLIGGFKVYDQVKVITNGGPGVGTTNTLAFDIVRYSVEAGQVGYGQAMATVMLAIIAFVSIFVLRALQRREVDL
ncbi:sugar ABC transporter permease [Microbacterium sp. 4R-513]|uniref:carbohydrate ABC transporter permease n=1 Tax=Microbacterium sp. 4R-513 TaxID=2567934 RepID=UPI0019D262F7|nr:sugar ABC transporter permease [Microbacterium sp. 4R-513]